MITLTKEEAEELLALVNSLWDECDYQLDEDEHALPLDDEEAEAWESDRKRCKAANDQLAKKLDAAERK